MKEFWQDNWKTIILAAATTILLRLLDPMERNQKCESVVLSREEKKLLAEIKRHPHTKCEYSKVKALMLMGLVNQDTNSFYSLHQPISLDTYCVSDFYKAYLEYRRKKRFWVLTQSLWMPILVSIITNLIILFW